MDRRAGEGVKTGVIHGRRNRHGQGNEVLDLFGVKATVQAIQPEIQGFPEARARVGAQKVVHEITPVGQPFVQLLKTWRNVS